MDLGQGYHLKHFFTLLYLVGCPLFHYSAGNERVGLAHTFVLSKEHIIWIHFELPSIPPKRREKRIWISYVHSYAIHFIFYN